MVVMDLVRGIRRTAQQLGQGAGARRRQRSRELPARREDVLGASHPMRGGGVPRQPAETRRRRKQRSMGEKLRAHASCGGAILFDDHRRGAADVHGKAQRPRRGRDRGGHLRLGGRARAGAPERRKLPEPLGLPSFADPQHHPPRPAVGPSWSERVQTARHHPGRRPQADRAVLGPRQAIDPHRRQRRRRQRDPEVEPHRDARAVQPLGSRSKAKGSLPAGGKERRRDRQVDAKRGGAGSVAAREDDGKAFHGTQLGLAHHREPSMLHHARAIERGWTFQPQKARVDERGAPGRHRDGDEVFLPCGSERVRGQEQRVGAAHRIAPVGECRTKQLVGRRFGEAETGPHRREERVDGERWLERLAPRCRGEPVGGSSLQPERPQRRTRSALDRDGVEGRHGPSTVSGRASAPHRGGEESVPRRIAPRRDGGAATAAAGRPR